MDIRLLHRYLAMTYGAIALISLGAYAILGHSRLPGASAMPLRTVLGDVFALTPLLPLPALLVWMVLTRAGVRSVLITQSYYSVLVPVAAIALVWYLLAAGAQGCLAHLSLTSEMARRASAMCASLATLGAFEGAFAWHAYCYIRP